MTGLIATKTISRARFDAFAGYARAPESRFFGKEIAWFEIREAGLLAVLIKDTDGEFMAMLMAADLSGKYRGVSQTGFFESAGEAHAALVQEAAKVLDNLEACRSQGDEEKPVDFFAKTPSKSSLHPTFLQLRDTAGWQAARSLISLQMRWYENQDGNFVEQFQTTGFDTRIWELYLFASFIEAGYRVEQPNPAPDFKLSGPMGRLQVEATTVNPTIIDGKATPSQRPSSRDEIDNYMANYLPIRYAGPLVAKLQKAYWDKPGWEEIPFAIAIQDFHDTMSMTFSGDALVRYLYGVGDAMPDGRPTRISTHTWGTKEIGSNFFGLPGSEQVAAVIFNASGTLPKFNRIGIGAALGVPGVHVRHRGTEYDVAEHDWKPFEREVTIGYGETWMDGMVVYHNPNALNPLGDDSLPGAAHFRWLGDDMEGLIPNGHLLRSTTAIIRKATRSVATPGADAS